MLSLFVPLTSLTPFILCLITKESKESSCLLKKKIKSNSFYKSLWGVNIMLSTIHKLYFNCHWKAYLLLPISSFECHFLNLDQDCMHKLILNGRRIQMYVKQMFFLVVNYILVVGVIQQNKGRNTIGRNSFFPYHCGCLE